MGRIQWFYILTTSFFLISCGKEEPIYQQLGLKEDMPHILFVSNENNYINESTYYDAILELKRTYPDEFKHLTVLNTRQDKDFLTTLDINESPCILVIYNDDILINISGEVTKEDIVKPIAKTLSQYH